MKKEKHSEYEISKIGNYSHGQLFKWIWSDYLKKYKLLIILVVNGKKYIGIFKSLLNEKAIPPA